MPSWWTRKSQSAVKEVNSEEHEESKERCRNNEASRTRMNKKKQQIKTKSFDETVLSSRSFPRTCLYLKASSSVSPKEASFFRGLHSNTLRETAAEKEAYPLPRPSWSLDLPSIKFNQKGVGLASAVQSSSSSPSSGSSTSAEDHGDFGSVRAFQETEWDSGFTVSPQRSESLRRRKLLQNPQLRETSVEFQTINDENWRNSCHPLPLPPCYVNGSSQHMQSKWIKGRLIGRGSFGQVHVGLNCTNGQLCAIKEVRAITEDQNSQDCLKQLNQEVAVLSQLSHPNIVEYYGSELGKGQLSVYLEYVSGGSVHKLLQEYGSFKESLIRNYTGQILLALSYLHARNTVHRDIKATNILVDPNGEIKLADFGMAKHMASSTSIISFKGSPHWMAPEVILNTRPFGLAVDIWSLGCTVIEMATSKPPWSEYEEVAAIFKIADSKDFPQIPAHLSANAQNFLKLCLQRDPLARPTAAQLLQHPFVQDHSCSCK